MKQTLSDDARHTFGGRLRPKAKPMNWENLVDLPNERLAFVYQRLSSHEQVKRHIWSQEAQNALVDLARDDGYPDELIYVEQRDLGISGTKGREDRPGLAYLIQQIEVGLVETIYVVHISRLHRDQTLINALSLGELLKEHGVIIVTPQMRLNLRDKMHMRMYRMEVERAADELELMAARLLGARDLKAKAGRYGGESLPTGYILDEKKKLPNGEDNPNYHSYQIHEPHAEIVRAMFERLTMPGMTPTQVARWCRRCGIVFPFFPPELDTPANRKTFLNTKTNGSGWLVTVGRMRSIARNPAYIGWRLWSGEVVDRDVFSPIVDEATFWRVQEQFTTGQKVCPKSDNDPLPLSGLLYCGNHDIPCQMTYANRIPAGQSLYQCFDADLQLSCANITGYILDGPISEAIISQVALPELAEEVLGKLTDEYGQAKEQAASYRREARRLDAEVENLRGNLTAGILSADQLGWIDQQVQERMARIRELADLESKPIGAAVGRPVPGRADIELVKDFLANLGEKWERQPNGLKNAFMRLLLDKVIIWPEPMQIKVRLFWRVGLEQELLIHRHCNGMRRVWSGAELGILRAHFETATRGELTAMLPGRSWRGIIGRGKRFGLSRAHHAGNPGQKAAPFFTPEEDNMVRRYSAGEIGLDEALSTGRTLESIRKRAMRLGLKRQLTWEWAGNNPPITERDSPPSACAER